MNTSLFLIPLTFSITRQRSTTKKATKPLNKTWAQAFQKRHPALKSLRVRAMAWEHHENNICDKITHWFEVIGKGLEDPALLPENVYNMDETGCEGCHQGQGEAWSEAWPASTKHERRQQHSLICCTGGWIAIVYRLFDLFRPQS